jgi:hypothetical protein
MMFITGLVLILVGRFLIRMFGNLQEGAPYIADIVGSFIFGVGIGTCLVAVIGVL